MQFARRVRFPDVPPLTSNTNRKYNIGMTKPDWAERLQKTFKRKYDLGYHEGQQFGYDEGFMVGSKKAVAEARKVFVKLIQEEIKSVSEPMIVDKEYLDGLERAIELIKKGK